MSTSEAAIAATTVTTMESKDSGAITATAKDLTTSSHPEEDDDDDDEEDLEKLQAEIARMEAEAARIARQTEELQNKSSSATASATAATAAAAVQSRDGFSIYVGQVDYSATPEELLAHFEPCGIVERVTICCDKFTGQPKGFAYLEFQTEDAVQNAVKLDGSTFKERQLKVLPKRMNEPGFNRGGRGGGRFPGGRGGGGRVPFAGRGGAPFRGGGARGRGRGSYRGGYSSAAAYHPYY